jgi:putative CocE/NonD family hydrolase
VLALIGGPALGQGLNRIQRSPLSGFDTAIGLFDAGIQGGLANPTLDRFWQLRGFQGDSNRRLPVLAIDSFFDVESRGAFQGFQALRAYGAHLMVVAGHDGYPARTDGGVAVTQAWFDHYLRGIRNRVARRPRVQLLMADGSRESYDAGNFVGYNARNWPVPRTQWESLWLSPTRSRSGGSLNDGTLSLARPSTSTTESYLAIPSLPMISDVPNAAFVGPDGLNQAATSFPLLTETALAEPLALTYTTPPLQRTLLSAGPAALDLTLSSTSPETAIWAVIADVWPDGSSHPLAVGRLLSAYPNIIRSKSLIDQHGDVVQPYGDYSSKADAPIGAARTYQIEFWPIGNQFKAGDRIRLVILGASTASSPSLPALNTVGLGGASASRLLLPMLPG